MLMPSRRRRKNRRNTRNKPTVPCSPEQSQRWLHNAKNELKARVDLHLRQRLAKIENVINESLPPDVCRLTIEESIRYQIFTEAKEAIDGYLGTKKLVKNLEPSQQSVIEKARTWWNRTKSYKLGGSFFAVICFYLLHNFIASHCSKLSEKERLILFIDIFRKFLTTSIKFHRTKPKPLILQQCFLHGGTFKDICMEFVYIFGDENIRWQPAITMGLCVENGRRLHKYIKDKNRSGGLSARFLECLQDVERKIVPYDEDNVWLKNNINRWKERVKRTKPHGYDVQFLKPSDQQNINAHSDHHFMGNHHASNMMQHTHNNVDIPLHVEEECAVNTAKHIENETFPAQNGEQSVWINYRHNLFSLQHNAQNNELAMDHICEIDDEYTRCKKIEIPKECQCKCIECSAAYICIENEFDHRQFQPMNDFGCVNNRIHRTYNELNQDIYETSERTLRLLQHLRSLWVEVDSKETER